MFYLMYIIQMFLVLFWFTKTIYSNPHLTLHEPPLLLHIIWPISLNKFCLLLNWKNIVGVILAFGITRNAIQLKLFSDCRALLKIQDQKFSVYNFSFIKTFTIGLLLFYYIIHFCNVKINMLHKYHFWIAIGA